MLKGAIVGFGKIARTSHMPAYQTARISSLAKIVAVADSDATLSEEVKDLYPYLKYYTSLEMLLDNEDIDFIDICTPPSCHLKAVEEAVIRGTHVLCEKPLAHNLASSFRMKLILEHSDAVFQACHQYKYSPVWKEFKKFAEQNADTGKMFFQFNVFRTGSDRGYFRNNPDWRQDKNISGGGILSDTGIHYIYLSNWFLGKPLRINAYNTNLRNDMPSAEDSAFVIIEYAAGVAQINLTWAADKRENNARAVCKNKSLVYSNELLMYSDGSVISEIAVPDMSDKKTYITQYEHLLEEFLHNIYFHNRQTSSLEEAYAAIRVLDACYKSDSYGQIIIPDEQHA